eukprot:COSAG06_NODE_10351_length_1697_cov_1.563204_2_plen_115_part_00
MHRLAGRAAVLSSLRVSGAQQGSIGEGKGRERGFVAAGVWCRSTNDHTLVCLHVLRTALTVTRLLAQFSEHARRGSENAARAHTTSDAASNGWLLRPGCLTQAPEHARNPSACG